MYKPATKEAWKGRTDAPDGELGLRWHQVISFLNISDELPDVPEGITAFALLGFCCDEGVRRNQGRVGAASGPGAIRAAMASLAWHLPEHVRLFDAGDVLCTNGHLEEAQVQLGQKITLLLASGYRPLVLGGGHEVAYGHYLGLREATEEQRLGILNFDAHFDLRDYTTHSSSGTSFLQIADRMQAKDREFRYNCIGIQEQGNTRILFETAHKLQVSFILAEEVQTRPFAEIKEKLQLFLDQTDAVYVSIDMDVFSAAYAPGVSAVNAMGLEPCKVLELLKHVIASGKLISLDIAEMNPEFDIDNRTAKLAATLLYQVVKECAKEGFRV